VAGKSCGQDGFSGGGGHAHLAGVRLLVFNSLMQLTERITVDPAICSGKPVIRGHRLTVQTLLEFLGAGESREELLRQYPFLEEEDINACLRFAAHLLDRSFVVQTAA
jgi:uncharacterized protein (DUF433 family)